MCVCLFLMCVCVCAHACVCVCSSIWHLCGWGLERGQMRLAERNSLSWRTHSVINEPVTKTNTHTQTHTHTYILTLTHTQTGIQGPCCTICAVYCVYTAQQEHTFIPKHCKPLSKHGFPRRMGLPIEPYETLALLCAWLQVKNVSGDCS